MLLPPALGSLTATLLPNGESLIYDHSRLVAHALDAVTTRVFQKCNGETTFESMVSTLTPQFGEASADLVRLALRHLEASQLLAEPLPVELKGVSRRSFLQRWGKAAAMVPVVAALAAPLPAAAASGGQDCPPCGGGTCCGVCQPCTGQGQQGMCCDGIPIGGTATTVAALLAIIGARALLTQAPRTVESPDEADPV